MLARYLTIYWCSKMWFILWNIVAYLSRYRRLSHYFTLWKFKYILERIVKSKWNMYLSTYFITRFWLGEILWFTAIISWPYLNLGISLKSCKQPVLRYYTYTSWGSKWWSLSPIVWYLVQYNFWFKHMWKNVDNHNSGVKLWFIQKIKSSFLFIISFFT